MSRLSNSLEQAMDELSDKKLSFIVKWLRAVRYFVVDLYYDYPHSLYRNIRNLYRNAGFFWPHIRAYRDFDYHYSLELFCDSLEHLAHGLKSWNNCTSSERNYKRCLFAAKQLRKAYTDESCNDKSYVELTKRNPIKWVPLENGMSQMDHDYTKGQEYYSKMFNLIRKRTTKAEKEAKKRAWAYIHKHIESFWD